jgi:hypothetical protein
MWQTPTRKTEYLYEWFNKHLNWTYAISLGILIIFLTLTLLFTFVIDSGLLILFLVLLVIASVLNIAAGVWVLQKKGQSLAYVAFIFVFSIAFIFLVLLLPNKRIDQVKISDEEYYNKREP